ncbi:Isoleucyl-tRNA synthetase [Legionella sainthelensi]|nr:Isoleucyl-tRNA synthetase [Legionella sainthelensi]
MAEYKDTLNLPNTSFPMKASLATREPEVLADWMAKKVYEKIRNARLGNKNSFYMMGLLMRTVICIVAMR